jgi:prepilin-type N-terminal cleavage/methylation domain-containing protein/prepilin-type processing-associated H-X9-DG protein
MSAITATRAKSNAFTLIELLVVIAIISLLVSILIPSLQKAKKLARKVVCSSNLHQVGIAFLLYRADWGGQYPAPFITDSYRWGHQLIPYLLDVDWSDYDTAKVGLHPKFWCPETDVDSDYAMNCYKAGSGAYYGWSNRHGEPDQYYQSYHFSENDLQSLGGKTRDPNYWILVFEANGTSATFYRWRTVHGGGSNVLFGDGALEFWPIDISDEDSILFRYNLSLAWDYWAANNYYDYYDRFLGPGWYF